MRNKVYSLINIFGLAIGIACCLLILVHVMDEFLFWKDSDHEKAQQEGWDVIHTMPAKRVLSAAQIEALIERVREQQQRVGYDNDFAKWAEQHKPVRLENLLESE